MDRSQRQLSRQERISNSPYKRPQSQSTLVTPKSPISVSYLRLHRPIKPTRELMVQSFPSLRSIYSFVTAPFSRQPLLPQTHQDLAIEEDQKSQSGSEDGWNGTAPPGMEREDLSSLAAVGRRGNSDIESRPEGNKRLAVGLFGPNACVKLTFRHPRHKRSAQASLSIPPLFSSRHHSSITHHQAIRRSHLPHRKP